MSLGALGKLAAAAMLGKLILCADAFALDQPMEAGSGYGSHQNDLCAGECAERHTLADITSPERVSYYVPKVLKNGATAPVVIFMHGFFAPVPEIYQEHINHLTRQGYIVIFPQYHAASWGLVKELGIFQPADQYTWMKNAITSTNRALKELGDMASLNEIYGYGHSIGGLLILSWDKLGGPKLRGLVLANPKLELKTGVPDFIKRVLTIKEIPWRDVISAVTGRIMILAGDADDIAPHSELAEVKTRAVNSAGVALYVATSDFHGEEKLLADHMAPTTNAGVLKYVNKMMGKGEGNIVLNTFDFRYYFAALDSLLDGQTSFEPDMGQWSDGHPFAKVKRLF